MEGLEDSGPEFSGIVIFRVDVFEDVDSIVEDIGSVACDD